MPIRFPCHCCGRPFEVSSQKAGRTLDCPQCGTRLTVPPKDGPSATPNASPRAPDGMILFPRRVYYLQAVLFVAVSGAALGLGYWMGLGDAGFQSQVQQERTQRERILVEGVVRRTAADGQTLVDQDSVVVAVPDALPPEKRIPIQGLRPTEPPPAAESATLRALREAGGGYGRADAEGHFSLVVPSPGTYRILVISRHGVRSADLDADVRASLDVYFSAGEELVGRSDYRWLQEQIQRGFNPIEIDFRGKP